ncbi:hypothetical protein WBJ53_05095 [Spirosoma sp. SC4-14]|uniref:hypothetical protein n=1 Tax=Spirosoma sp. SC4-14 TaxID=3128900 RepID=UPI0030D34CD7
MKVIVLAALAALPFSTQAQQTNPFAPFPENGIYLSAADFAKHQLTDSFNDGQAGYRLHQETFERAIKVDQPNAPEEKIPLSDLWGERKQGVDYRIFDGDQYKVEHSDRVYIYSKPTNIWISGGGNTYSPVQYYFSRKADSPVHLITSNNLKDIFYDQPEKFAAFEKIDDSYAKPAEQARKLLQLFYTTDNSHQAVSAAE